MFIKIQDGRQNDVDLFQIIILSFTSPLVFLLPSDAGEKCGTSLTVLLSFAVYLSVVSEYLPSTSLSVSTYLAPLCP